jgi:sirohydrochlorin ferrochelatase
MSATAPGPARDEPPVLLAVAHGTRHRGGQAQVRALVDQVAARRPDLAVDLTYLDVQQPRLVETVASRRRPTVAVPLLLAAGYHVRADVPAAVAPRPHVSVAAPLGPDPVLTMLLARELWRADGGLRAGDAVVVAAAGSRDARARADVEVVTAGLAARLTAPADAPVREGEGVGRAGRAGGVGAVDVCVRTAYVTASEPGVPLVADVVAELRAAGARRVLVGAYLLADGLFYRSLLRSGADVVTPPLGLCPDVVDLVLARYDATVAEGAARGPELAPR